jgi:MFS transporter, OFA family, oxalate/formate antiporter
MSIMNRWTVAVAAVVMQLGLGSLYAWSVFRQPLSAHYSASVTGVNVAFFVAILVFGISTLAAGFLLRHVGPRFVGVAGGVLFGTGVFLSAFAEGSLPFLYFTYGVVAAVGGGLGYMVPIAVLPKWFPDRPGLAYGLAVVGFGIGPVINVPLISTILSATGGPFRTFAILGISYTAMIGGAAWFVRTPLEDREPPVPEGREQGDEKVEGTSYYLRGALGTWQWYALWVVFLLNTTVGVAVYSDAKAMAGSIGGATAAVASGFVMIIAVSDTAGRLVWPILSDKIGGANVFLAMFLVQAAALLMMPVLGAGSFVLFCVLASAVASCYGGGYATMTMSALAATYYGSRDIGTIYGGILTASSVAGFGAPLLLARSADVTGSYDLALYATGGIMLVGAVIPLALKAPRPSR